MAMHLPDDVDRLTMSLKALPLIEGADLDKPFAAYDAFELVCSAILRAALVQAPEEGRKRNNGRLFEAFVTDHFPVHRGRNDPDYAKQLWLFRNAFVKEKRTEGFALVHGAPNQHLGPRGLMWVSGRRRWRGRGRGGRRAC